jgi:two-component system, NarL family, response regulator
LTIYEGDEDIHQALEAGAQGYIIKGMPYELLIQALQRVNSGGRFLPRHWSVRWSFVSRTLS